MTTTAAGPGPRRSDRAEPDLEDPTTGDPTAEHRDVIAGEDTGDTEEDTADEAAGEDELLSGAGDGPSRRWGLLLLVGSALGFVASMVLTIDRIHLLENPDALFACDISPFVACGPAMSSAAGELFGFPNPLLGIAGFAVTGATGAIAASRVRPPRWYLVGLQLGVLAAAVFISWLQFHTVTTVNAICLWCTLVWAVTIPIVLTTTVTNLRVGTLGDRARPLGRALRSWQGVLVLTWYLVVLCVIVLRFYREFALYWFGISL